MSIEHLVSESGRTRIVMNLCSRRALAHDVEELTFQGEAVPHFYTTIALPTHVADRMPSHALYDITIERRVVREAEPTSDSE